MFWLLIKCRCCGGGPVTPNHRQRTAYVDDSQNWAGYLCQECKQENVDYWDDMWADYYRDIWSY